MSWTMPSLEEGFVTLTRTWQSWQTKGEGTQARELSPMLVNAVDGSELILIPEGLFLRGSREGEGGYDEQPEREVYLKAFYLAKYPVTNRQYRSFLEQSRHAAPAYWKDKRYNQDDQPVVGVTWQDAYDYCQWSGLRLPTEAEWEKAAGWDETGQQKRRYPWGDVDPDETRANFGCRTQSPTSVREHPGGASAYGCVDMAGNVLEWVHDWYDWYDENMPRGPGMRFRKIVRGGSMFLGAYELRTAYRHWLDGQRSYVAAGFRCARDARKVERS